MQIQTNFHYKPQQELAELLKKQGLKILEEPQRCRHWLLFACPEQKCEINVLLHALEDKVPQALLAGAVPKALAGRLIEDFAITQEGAEYAVETWRRVIAASKEFTDQEQSITSQPPQKTPVTQVSSSHQFPTDLPHGEHLTGNEKTKLIVGLEQTLRFMTQHREAAASRDPCTTAAFGWVFLVLILFPLIALSAKFPAILVIAAILLVCGALGISTWKGILEASRQEKTAAAEAAANSWIAYLSDRFPESVRAWGGRGPLSSRDFLISRLHELKADHITTNLSSVTPHRGQLILALGILGWLFPILSAFAWCMGHNDQKAMDEGRMDRAGYSLTQSGKTLGMIVTLIYSGILVLAFIARSS